MDPMTLRSDICVERSLMHRASLVQETAKKYADELGVQTVPSLNVVYTEEQGYVTADVAEQQGLKVRKLSGTKFRKMLRNNEEIPEWFAFKSVVKVLKEHTTKQ